MSQDYEVFRHFEKNSSVKNYLGLKSWKRRRRFICLHEIIHQENNEMREIKPSENFPLEDAF